MTTIALIGAGNLGSRHLQALALLDSPATVYVLDPSAASRDIARGRFEEMRQENCSVRIQLVDTFDALPDAIDVAIVATSADVRLEVVRRLLAQRSVRFAILEKVLAQHRDDLRSLEEILKTANVRAWVNYPRRQWSFYRNLRTSLVEENALSLSVSGSKWGLASNTVHFVDLLAFFGGENIVVAGSALRSGSAPSARQGFIEVFGCLLFSGARERILSVTSFTDGAAPLTIEIRTPTLIAHVSESGGIARIATHATGWRFRDEPVDVQYQSKLTHLVVQDLLATNDCELTPLSASVLHHDAFLAALSAHLGKPRCEVT